MSHYRRLGSPTIATNRHDSTEVDIDSDTEVVYTSRKYRQMKLNYLNWIRVLLIAMLILQILFVAAFITLVLVVGLPMVDPLMQSLGNVRALTERANSLSTHPAISSTLAAADYASRELPSFYDKFVQPLTALNTTGLFNQGLATVGTVSNLLDSIVDVDPGSLLTYLREKQILERVIRLLQGANNLLDRVENPETRQLIDRMTSDTTMLVGFAKTLIAEINSTGFTIKIH